MCDERLQTNCILLSVVATEKKFATGEQHSTDVGLGTATITTVNGVERRGFQNHLFSHGALLTSESHADSHLGNIKPSLLIPRW